MRNFVERWIERQKPKGSTSVSFAENQSKEGPIITTFTGEKISYSPIKKESFLPIPIATVLTMTYLFASSLGERDS